MKISDNKQLGQITNRFSFVTNLVKRYKVMIFFLIFAGIYGFLVIQINSMVQNEPSQNQVAETEQQIRPLKIDESAVRKIYELESTNIEVRSLFNQARNNPFKE